MLRNFVALLVDKFFANQYDTVSYQERIQELTRASNETCLENMSMAVSLMTDRTVNEILDNWSVLERLAKQEVETDQYITSALDYLMRHPPSAKMQHYVSQSSGSCHQIQ